MYVCSFTGNADEFVAMSERSTPPGLKVIHTIDPVDLTVKQDRALSHSNATINTRTTIGGVACDITSWVRALSRLERVGGEWKMLSLDVIYNRDSLMPACPQDESMSLEGIGKFRSSYSILAWFMSSRGLRVPDELPGEDRPETVSEVVQRNQRLFEAD